MVLPVILYYVILNLLIALVSKPIITQVDATDKIQLYGMYY